MLLGPTNSARRGAQPLRSDGSLYEAILSLSLLAAFLQLHGLAHAAEHDATHDSHNKLLIDSARFLQNPCSQCGRHWHTVSCNEASMHPCPCRQWQQMSCHSFAKLVSTFVHGREIVESPQAGCWHKAKDRHCKRTSGFGSEERG